MTRQRLEPLRVNPRISPDQENKKRCQCTHPLNWHDAEGCRYGCGCAKPFGKGKKNVTSSSSKSETPETHDTLFAAALDRAADGLETAAIAFREAATEARRARAAAYAAQTPPMPEILASPAEAQSVRAATPRRPAVLEAPVLFLTKGGNGNGAQPASIITHTAPHLPDHPPSPGHSKGIYAGPIASCAYCIAQPPRGERSPPVGETDAATEDLIRALSSGARKVLAAADLYPQGAKTTQLVAQTGLSARTIQNNLVDLRRVGFVTSGAPVVTDVGKAFLATNPVDFTPRELAKGEIAVLKALDVCKGRATTRLLAMHTKLSQRTIQNILIILRREGFVTRGTLGLTPEGTARLGDDATPILTGQALIEARASELPDGEATVFSILVTLVDGSETSTSDLAARTGLSPRTIQNILVELRRRVLVARGTPPRVSDEIAHAVRESRASA